jgi:hypothetical protein
LLSCVEGELRTPISAAGIPITTSSIADTSIATWGRWVLAQDVFGGFLVMEAGSSPPSNLRMAAVIAASRRAGCGGGGSGSQSD